MDSDRILTSGVHREDGEIETSLRPRSLRDYVGQTSVKDSLSIYIKAALERHDALDHMLLYGPPGLGKTTLACSGDAEGNLSCDDPAGTGRFVLVRAR